MMIIYIYIYTHYITIYTSKSRFPDSRELDRGGHTLGAHPAVSVKQQTYQNYNNTETDKLRRQLFWFSAFVFISPPKTHTMSRTAH